MVRANVPSAIGRANTRTVRNTSLNIFCISQDNPLIYTVAVVCYIRPNELEYLSLETLRELFHSIGRLFTWWIIIVPWEQAVRVRLGKHVRILTAGVHLRIPYADKVYKQSIRRRIVATDIQTISTRDGKAITLAGQMGYSIVDVGKLYATLHHAEDTLQALMKSSVSEFVSTHELSQCTPKVIEAHVIENNDLSEYGLAEITFSITNFAVARTYRFITDNLKEWLSGDVLNTDQDDRYHP